MFDTLSIIPLWAIVLFHLTLGVIVGIVQARRGGRGEQRLGGMALILAGMLVLAVGWAARWDWNTRKTPLGGQADTELRYNLEAQGTTQPYLKSRRRWLDMTSSEQWKWRLTMATVVSVSFLSGSLPPFLWMTRRGERQKTGAAQED